MSLPPLDPWQERLFWRYLTEAFERAMMGEQYGTSMHYPACRSRSCTGCVPDAPPIEYREERPPFDLSIFRRDVSGSPRNRATP